MSQRPAVLTEETEELRKKVALLGKLILSLISDR